MPEQLAEGSQALIEKLEAFENLDVDEVIAMIEEFNSVDFPLGFGRD